MYAALSLSLRAHRSPPVTVPSPSPHPPHALRVLILVFSHGSIWLCGCTKRPTFFPFTCFVGPHWYYLLVTYIVIAIPTAIAIGVASLVSPWIVGLGGVLTLCLYTFLSCVGCSNPRIIEKQSLTRAQVSVFFRTLI